MVSNVFSSILLTYKGKILLLSPDSPVTGAPQHLWSFIGGKNIEAQIKYTTKLELKNINLLTSRVDNHGKYFYHGALTDHDVNSMERREGQRLEFFTLVELEKLNLTDATQGILTEYKNAVEKLLS